MKHANKGFSLVELIIVIAIMAVLIGVLAPQYIKYVEKSRISADENTAGSLYESAFTMLSDELYFDSINSGDTIQFSSAGIVASNSAIASALGEYYSDDLSQKKPKSKKHQGETYTVTFSRTARGDFDVFEAWN